MSEPSTPPVETAGSVQQQLPPQAPPPAGQRGRRYPGPERIATLGLAALGAIGIVVAAIWPVRSVDSGPTSCIMMMTTGLPCPGCGMTRSWVHLAHGDVSGAFTYNLFGPVLFLVVIAFVGFVAVSLLRRKRPERIFEWLQPRWVVAGVGLWLGYAVVRMVSLGLGYDTFSAVVA